MEDLKTLRSQGRPRLAKGIILSTSDDLQEDYERNTEDDGVSKALRQSFTQSSTNEKDIHLFADPLLEHPPSFLSFDVSTSRKRRLTEGMKRAIHPGEASGRTQVACQERGGV